MPSDVTASLLDSCLAESGQPANPVRGFMGRHGTSRRRTRSNTKPLEARSWRQTKKQSDIVEPNVGHCASTLLPRTVRARQSERDAVESSSRRPGIRQPQASREARMTLNHKGHDI
jgi:hypothetical protein